MAIGISDYKLQADKFIIEAIDKLDTTAPILWNYIKHYPISYNRKLDDIITYKLFENRYNCFNEIKDTNAWNIVRVLFNLELISFSHCLNVVNNLDKDFYTTFFNHIQKNGERIPVNNGFKSLIKKYNSKKEGFKEISKLENQVTVLTAKIIKLKKELEL